MGYTPSQINANSQVDRNGWAWIFTSANHSISGAAFIAMPFIASTSVWRIWKVCKTRPFRVWKLFRLNHLQWRILCRHQGTKESVNVAIWAGALVMVLATLMPASVSHKARKECRAFHRTKPALSKEITCNEELKKLAECNRYLWKQERNYNCVEMMLVLLLFIRDMRL